MSGIRIKVTDNGIGIGPEDRKNLFKLYFKTQDQKSRDMNKGSHGIGLNMCKRFAELLGGDLYLNEDYNNGCEFVLKLFLKREGFSTFIVDNETHVDEKAFIK